MNNESKKNLERLKHLAYELTDIKPVIEKISIAKNLYDLIEIEKEENKLALGSLENLTGVKIVVNEKIRPDFAEIKFSNGKIINAIYSNGKFYIMTDSDKNSPVITEIDFTSKSFETYRDSCLHIKADNITCDLSEIECEKDNCPRLEKFNHTNKYRSSFSLAEMPVRMKR